MEHSWLNTLEEKVKATDNLPESTEAVSEALEVQRTHTCTFTLHKSSNLHSTFLLFSAVNSLKCCLFEATALELIEYSQWALPHIKWAFVLPGDWCGKDNCVKPKHPLNILSPSITVSDFVFQVPPAFPCRVAISVDCLQRSCQTHFYHSVAPVMLHSDEENWRALKTVLIFALMFFGS